MEQAAAQSTKSAAASPVEARVAVAPGVALHVERYQGAAATPTFVLVHGLASNLRLWDGVAERLHALGHGVMAVDQRGHGRSDAPETGYDLETAMADLRAVVAAEGLARPILAGQSWGANVVLELGWQHPEAVRGVACVDGGIVDLADRFDSWEACLAALTPPRLDHLTLPEFEGRMRREHPELPERAVAAALACFRVRKDGRIEPRLARARHLLILRSLWEHRPSTRFATLATPAMFILADTGDVSRTGAKRRAEEAARAASPRVRAHWFAPAHHDVHAQFPERVADLLARATLDGFFS
jgi:pimeloyl-ACP methyl ester carboxylesterase